MIDFLLDTPLDKRQELFLALFPDYANLDHPGKRRFLGDLLAAQDLEPFREAIADDLVAAIRLRELLPEVYADFRPIVEDGVRFLLSRIHASRLCGLITDQALLPGDCPPGERMLSLAAALPTLHKLGQIIARNRAIDPGFRQWLQKLESSVPRTTFADLRPTLFSELSRAPEAPSVLFDAEPLAEASVGVVIGFRMPKPRIGGAVDGVAKLVKPLVHQHLQEEIALLDQLAAHFDLNRASYPLHDFGYARVFNEVKESLRQEVDLAHEQRNLEAACHMYLESPEVEIPRPLPWSTPCMTLMTRVSGESLDRFSGTARDRAAAARSLFWNLVGKPLFERSEMGLFHGDPHAGNLLLCKATNGSLRIGILDWSQAIRLTRRQRQSFLQVALGVATCDPALARSAMRDLVNEPLERHPRRDELDAKIHLACQWNPVLHGALQKTGLLGRTLDLIDTLALRGFAFPGELLWFRKSVFTLLGVLADLDHSFDADHQVLEWLTGLVLQDLPRRWAAGFNPLIDRAKGYRSFLSNLDLCGCLQHAMVTGVSESWRLQRRMMHHSLEGASTLARRFWLPFAGLSDGDPADQSSEP